MTTPNGAILRGAGPAIDQALSQLVQVSKADGVMTTANTQSGDFANRKAVEKLVDLMVSLGGWTSGITTFVRGNKSGEIPRMNIAEPITEHVAENTPGVNGYQRPTTDHIEYVCRKMHSSWSITYDDVREAMASGETALGQAVQRIMAKRMINDIALLAIRGNRTLDSSTKMNRLLRAWNGLQVRALADGVVRTTLDTLGRDFDGGVFGAMLNDMPDEYKHDNGLRWMLPPVVDADWLQSLTHVDQTPANQTGSNLRDQLITSRLGPAPMGVPQILVPQIPTDDNNGQAAIDPDAGQVVDNGGTIEFGVSDLFADATDYTGRRVKVTCLLTGETETRPITRSGGANIITTTGTLGQGTVSTTNTDYSIEMADGTFIYLTHPRNLYLVFWDGVRSYKRWNQEVERWEIDVHYDAEFGVFNEDALVVQRGVVPSVPTWE